MTAEQRKREKGTSGVRGRMAGATGGSPGSTPLALGDLLPAALDIGLAVAAVVRAATSSDSPAAQCCHLAPA